MSGRAGYDICPVGVRTSASALPVSGVRSVEVMTQTEHAGVFAGAAWLLAFGSYAVLSYRRNAGTV